MDIFSIAYTTLTVVWMAIVIIRDNFCLSASDWAAWFGAIGTIGTLIGTIWLATAKDRIEKQQALRQAHVIAVGLAPLLEVLTKRLNDIYFGPVFQNYDGFSNMREEAEPFLSVENIKISPADLMTLTVLDGDYAFRLAKAITMLTLVQSDVRADLAKIGPYTFTNVQELLEKWTDKIGEVKDMFDIVGQKFTIIARESAKTPTTFELHANDY